MRQPPPSLWFWGILLCLAALAGLRFDLRRRIADAAPATTLVSGLPDAGARRLPQATSMGRVPEGGLPESGPFESAGPTLAQLTAPGPPPVARAVADTLGVDDSIYLSLKRHGVPELEVLRLIEALRPVFDPRTASRPGDTYALALDSTEAILRFEYTPSSAPDRPVVVGNRDGSLAGEQLRLPLERRTRVVRLLIDDNLSNAVAAIGETDALTDLLADVIFGSLIDFHRDPRRGDHIDLVYSKLYRGDTFVRYGRVELARYEGQTIARTAVYHDTGRGTGGYYDETGASLERMFLLKPLSYRRISSPFSRRRFHPVLKRNRPHLGTDYAAAPGTQVMATAGGRVTLAGWNGGYGKMVEIEHANGYRTRYAHLSRVLVRRGQRVGKRQVIGRVGSTGLATGPHLHYELLRRGLHLNPVTANRGSSGAPLEPADVPAFARRRNALLDLVAAYHDGGQMAAGAAARGM